MAKLRAMFEAGDRLTAHDVEARLFVDVRNAREYLKLLHSERVIRICSYRRDTPHGRPTPVFEAGADPDCRPPKRAEERRKEAARIREKARARAMRAADEFVQSGGLAGVDPILAALHRDGTMMA